MNNRDPANIEQARMPFSFEPEAELNVVSVISNGGYFNQTIFECPLVNMNIITVGYGESLSCSIFELRVGRIAHI